MTKISNYSIYMQDQITDAKIQERIRTGILFLIEKDLIVKSLEEDFQMTKEEADKMYEEYLLYHQERIKISEILNQMAIHKEGNQS